MKPTPRTSDGCPTLSWWVGLPRDQFAKKVSVEFGGMVTSKYGRISSLATAPRTATTMEIQRQARGRRDDE